MVVLKDNLNFSACLSDERFEARYVALTVWTRISIDGSEQAQAMTAALGRWVCFLVALLLCGTVFADIRTTSHSLIKNSTKPDASDVCIFCHTPNVDISLAGNGSATDPSPAWQKSLSTTHEYVIYDDIGRVGLGKLSVGSQSVACLSCHDGTQAPAVNKGLGDHPFGVPYRGANKNELPSRGAETANNSSAATKNAAKKIVELEDFREVSRGIIEDRSVFWVSKLGVTQRRTRADLPVYGRQSAEYERVVPYIECSSCHDPHNDKDLFLRTSNTGSQLCLTCHIK